MFDTCKIGALALAASLVVTADLWAELSSDSINVVAVPSGGQAITAKCDAQGVIHLIFDSSDGPQYVSSRDNGKTLAQPIPIVDAASRKPGLVFNAWDLALGAKGSVHVALGTNAWKLKLPQEEWGFFYARLEPGATAFTAVQNLNRKPSEGFSLAADERGNVTACWLSDKLYANVSHDNGRSFAPSVQIDSGINPCNCCTTSCTYAADGRLAVLYREEANDDRDMYLVLWNQEANKVSRQRVSTTGWKINACPMTYYTVSSNGDGFSAVWPTKGQIYFARLNPKGELLPPGEIKTAGQSGMRTGMLILVDHDGNTVVAWKKDGELFWQAYDEKGQPSGKAGSVKSAGSGAAGVVTKDGRFLLFR